MRVKFFINLIITLFCVLLYGCTMSTPKARQQSNRHKQETNGYSTTSETGSAASLDNKDENQSLDMYLSRFSGVNVTGTGGSATIRIRGISSFITGNEPMFILDGQQMGSFSQVYSLVSPQNISRVTVLKDAADTSIYGARGTNGVILVYRKRVEM